MVDVLPMMSTGTAFDRCSVDSMEVGSPEAVAGEKLCRREINAVGTGLSEFAYGVDGREPSACGDSVFCRRVFSFPLGLNLLFDFSFCVRQGE